MRLSTSPLFPCDLLYGSNLPTITWVCLHAQTHMLNPSPKKLRRRAKEDMDTSLQTEHNWGLSLVC